MEEEAVEKAFFSHHRRKKCLPGALPCHPVAISCARTLLDEIREMDVAARLSSDEFALLLSHATKKDAAGRFQQFGWRLNNLSLAWRGEIVPVRVSLELQEYRKGDTPRIIFSATDMALYGFQNQPERKAGMSVRH